MTDPRAAGSPEVLDALRLACAAARRTVDGDLLELARLRVATLLDVPGEASAPPWGVVAPTKVAALDEWPTSEWFDERERTALALTEQFVIDVTAVSDGPLGPAATLLGAQVVSFVQALFLLDVGQRVAAVLGRLGDATLTSEDWAWPAGSDDAPDDQSVDVMESVMAMLAAVGRLRRVDPVTKELLRLRGARLHRCRRCQSVRSVAALEAGADLALLGAEDPTSVADLPDGTRAAVDLVDATFLGRPVVDDDLRDRLTGSFDADELVEICDYLLRNAANKVAVAFGADGAIVTDGFEYQMIDAAGETITVEGPPFG